VAEAKKNKGQNEPTEMLSVRIPVALRARLDTYRAKLRESQRRMSVQDCVNEALVEYLKSHKA
jgi:hypothetical protein